MRNGRITLDEPTELPEGAAVELVAIGTDADDDMDEEDRRRLHEALSESDEDIRAGRVRDAGEVIAELRRRYPHPG